MYLNFGYIKALDLKRPELYRGEPKSGKADATLTIEDSDMIQMVSFLRY